MKVQITEEMKKEMTEKLTERLTGALDAESNEPKPFNLRARIQRLTSDANSAIANDTLMGAQIMRQTHLDLYPARLRALREQINALSEIAGELLKPWTNVINEIKADIAGDKTFSNEEKRRIELESRLAELSEYQADLNEHAALTGAIKRLSNELESTIDEFRTKRLMYERETAQIIAAGIQVTTIEE